jgi:hypothetical protein
MCLCVFSSRGMYMVIFIFSATDCIGVWNDRKLQFDQLVRYFKISYLPVRIGLIITFQK